jgi:hypothetical protein
MFVCTPYVALGFAPTNVLCRRRHDFQTFVRIDPFFLRIGDLKIDRVTPTKLFYNPRNKKCGRVLGAGCGRGPALGGGRRERVAECYVEHSQYLVGETVRDNLNWIPALVT